MKHKHILIITLFVFFVCTLVAAQTRKIEAKKKPQESSALNNPEIVYNIGHSDSVFAVSYSPDGKYVASGSHDNTVKIWEVETARCLKTLRGHTDGVQSIAYSPDGKYISSGASDGKVKCWEVESGRCIQTDENATGISCITYSPDGKDLAIAKFSSGMIQVKNLETGVFSFFEVQAIHKEFIRELCYSPDGKYLASGSEDKTIKIWDVQTKKCICTLEGHTNGITALAYSPDGKYLASGSHDHTIKIWKVANWKCITTLNEHKLTVHSIVYSPDGGYFASSSADDTIKIWKTAKNKCIKTLEGHKYRVLALSYSPDGKYIASGAGDKTVRIWDIKNNTTYKSFGSYVDILECLAYSPDGKYLATGGANAKVNIRIRDIENGRPYKTFLDDTGVSDSVFYSPDGKYIVASSSSPESLMIFDVITKKKIKTFYRESSYGCATYSPNGEYIASNYNYENVINIIDAKTFKQVLTLEKSESVNTIAYSPDGRYIACGTLFEGIKFYDAHTGKYLKTFSKDRKDINSIDFSPDGKYIAVGVGSVLSTGTAAIDIWEIASEKQKILYGNEKGAILSIKYSPDGKYIIAGASDSTIKIFDISNTHYIILEGHSDNVTCVSYSPDGKYIASASEDGTIKFWNSSTGDLLATTFNLKDDEWLTYTPEGFFAGSEWASKNLVHIVDGMKIIGIDQMYDSLYRPDLVAAKLSGEDISPYAQRVSIASLVQTGSAPVVTFLSLEDEFKDRDVTIEFTIQNTGGGIGEVNLLLNGKNIRLAEKAPSKTGETVHFSHTITLQNGKNTVELYAKNEAGKVESLHVSKTLNWQGSVKKPNLYIFTVAINKYRDRRLQLKYAVPDAEFILKGFSSQKKSLYQNIFTHHLFDDNVTKDGIKSSFEKLGNEVQADDVFVFYIAGHGITYDEDGDYYYLPSNFRFTSSEAIQQQGISKNDLTRYLSLIKASKTLMLMDTCNAGSFLGNNTRGLSEQTAIDRLSRSTGHATIVASSDDQVAMEGYEGHGIFTYILVEGLRGKADTDGDGFITLQELSAYTEEEVPRRSYEKWGYEQTPMRNLRRQDFPIYTSGNR